MQTELLFKIIGEPISCDKFIADKWAAAVAFTMAHFKFPDEDSARGILDELIPNNTPSWNVWKKCICSAIQAECEGRTDLLPSKMLSEIVPESSKSNMTPVSEMRQNGSGLSKKDRNFIESFLERADAVFTFSKQKRDEIDKKREDAEKSADDKKQSTSIYIENVSDAA